MQAIRKQLFSVTIVFIAIVFALVVAEGVVRLKNASMKNYDIEMWKYALKLKTISDNPILGHEHIPSRSAVLQSVSIRTNELGLRGGSISPPTAGERRILFLGSSVTLGWGVPEDQTVTERLKQKFAEDGQQVVVLNAGIGNYNAERYVERFITRLQTLAPTDIVVHYVLRDAETLEPARKNFLLRHSQLATTLWIVTSRHLSKFREPSLEEHYRKVYDPAEKGFKEMQVALERLANYCYLHHIRLYFAMIPDIHDLADYKFTFIHKKMSEIVSPLGYAYVDLLPGFTGLRPEEVWAMPGDPHPNALGHQRMAEILFPILAQT